MDLQENEFVTYGASSFHNELISNIYFKEGLTLIERLSLWNIYREYYNNSNSSYNYYHTLEKFLADAQKDGTYTFLEIQEKYKQNIRDKKHDIDLNQFFVKSLIKFKECEKYAEEMYLEQERLENFSLMKLLTTLIT